MARNNISSGKVEVSAAAVRDFLRQAAQLPEWDAKFIRAVLGIDAGKVSEVLQWMQVLGHIELISSRKSTWRNTEAGNALAHVKPVKPLKRETIEKALNELPERIRLVNTSPQHAYAVAQAALFGPYYTTDADVGSADVAVKLIPKRAPNKGKDALPVNGAEAQNSRRAILRLLKGRGRGLTLFESESWMLKQPHRIVFKTPSN